MIVETLAEQPIREQRKSYEPTASANRIRYDLENFGADSNQKQDSEIVMKKLSYLVEGIDKASRTAFVLQRQGEDIVYFDEGEWKDYKGLLYTGLNIARHEAAADSRRTFLVEAATEDLVNGNIMCGLQPGEQHVWWSSYEYEVEDQYGSKFMQACGRQPDRQMGFLYRAQCQEDGSILLESQTLDRSHEGAFAAIEEAATNNPDADMDELVDVYDGVIYEEYGVECYAGRPEAEREENAWDEVQKHRDLIEYHLNTLETIAAEHLTAAAFKEAVKKHTYGVWAAFKKRIEGEALPHISSDSEYVSHQFDHQLHVLLEQETKTAFQDFVSQGKVMVGCGGGFGMVSGESDIMNASGSDVHSSIFGGDKFGSLTFTCSNGHHNKRPHGKLLKACQHEGCKAKVACK